MSGAALAFLIGSWASVLGLTAWCFARVLRAGLPGPAGPPAADVGESSRHPASARGEGADHL